MSATSSHIGIRADYFLSMAGGKAFIERDRFVGIVDGRIAVIEPFHADRAQECTKFLDLQGRVVLPGLVNAHTHLPMTLLRGIEDDVELHHWLFDRIFPLEAKFMNREHVALGTKLAALECARFGVTTVNDMYFHTGTEMETWDQSGLRGQFSQSFINFPTPEDSETPSQEESFLRLFRKFEKHGRIRTSMGPHAPYSCQDEKLDVVARLSRETGALVQIHLHETQKEVDDSVAQFGRRPTQRLKDLGVLANRPIFHHGVHLNRDDIRLIAEVNGSVVYNPDSNMKLGSGVAPIRDLIDGGVNVAIGTDGAASANSLCLLSAMNIGAKLQKVHAGRTDIIRAEEMLYLATLGGARALGWDADIGSLEVGKAADLIAVDLEQPHLQPVNDALSHLVYAARGQDVDTTIVSGRVLMENRQLKLPWTLADLRPQLEVLRSAIRKTIEELKLKNP